MALPVYSMSCYRLSNTLYQHIEQRMARCWWGAKGETQKMHWAKWQKLTERRDSGGLEFRDLRATNDALLAKQVWRVLHEPNLLVSKVLECRYFPDKQFFQTKPKGRDSWIWKSWLSIQDLICHGGRWKVGDGRQIRIWED